MVQKLHFRICLNKILISTINNIYKPGTDPAFITKQHDNTARNIYVIRHHPAVPLWALLLSILAYYTPLRSRALVVVTTLLMLIMFGMGVHLKSTTLNACSRPARLLQGFSCTTW